MQEMLTLSMHTAMTSTLPAAILMRHCPVSAVAVCPSLDISITPTSDRIITELSRPAPRAYLTTKTEDWSSRQSWLRTVEADLRPMNLGLATAKRLAHDRSAWRKLVATVIRRLRHAPEEEEEVHSRRNNFCSNCLKTVL